MYPPDGLNHTQLHTLTQWDSTPPHWWPPVCYLSNQDPLLLLLLSHNHNLFPSFSPDLSLRLSEAATGFNLPELFLPFQQLWYLLHSQSTRTHILVPARHIFHWNFSPRFELWYLLNRNFWGLWAFFSLLFSNSIPFFIKWNSNFNRLLLADDIPVVQCL